MFSAFLSKDMTYSCAIFSDLDGDLLAPDHTQVGGLVNGVKSIVEEDRVDKLEEAQLRKIR